MSKDREAAEGSPREVVFVLRLRVNANHRWAQVRRVDEEQAHPVDDPAALAVLLQSYWEAQQTPPQSPQL